MHELMVDARADVENIQISLEHLVLPESKEMLKQTNKIQHTHNTYCDECMLKEPSERAPSGISQSNLNNKIVLDHNPKYKIHIHESKQMT